MDAAELLRRRGLPKPSDARAAICYLAVRHCGCTGVEVGRHLGLGRSGTSAAVRRGEDVVREAPELLQALGLQR